MINRRHKWKLYWSERDEPGQAFSHDTFYPMLATTLLALCEPREIRSILEFGCGNGALFEFLHTATSGYTGIDQSQAMVDSFRRSHSEVDVRVGDACSYVDPQQQYDLIFSYGMLQYLTSDMLSNHFTHCRAMMHDASILICGGLPMRVNRSDYLLGRFSPPYTRRGLFGFRRQLARLIRGDELGTWFEIPELIRIGEGFGFTTEVFSDPHYLYRMNVRFVLAADS